MEVFVYTAFIASANISPTDRTFIFGECPLNGMLSVTTSSSRGDLSIFSMASPERTGCVARP
jgi:hypothetical protein